MRMLIGLVAALASVPTLAHAQAADTATVEYEVGGVRVIHRRLAANEIVAVNLYLLGGSRQLDEKTAGIEAMLLRMSEYGTQSYPGYLARHALGKTGSRLVIDPGPDWTMVAFRGIRAEFDSTWSIFADRVTRPVLNSGALEIVRGRMLRAARSQLDHPDGMLRALADSMAFAGHPYQLDPEGSEASLKAITIDALQRYLDTQMVTSRMLLVVVGNVSREQVEGAINRTFAKIPRGDYVWTLPPAWEPPRTTITSRSRPLPTNYILGYFGGPTADSRDWLPFQVATSIMGGLASGEIRDGGFSYAPGAPYLERAASGGGIYVTTTRPDTTIKIFNSAIELLREVSIPRSALQRAFNGASTGYYAENESNAGQAAYLARYELLHGDWRQGALYREEYRKVLGGDVRRVARRYLKNIQYVYIGNPRMIPERQLRKY